MPLGLGGTVAKKRGAVAPAEQEMVTLLGSGKGQAKAEKPRSTKRGTAFSAVRGMIPTRMIPSMGGTKASDIKKRAKGVDELKVSLLDSDGKPTAPPRERKHKGTPSPPWTMDRIKRYACLLVATALVTFLLFNRQRDVHWDKLKNLLQPQEKGGGRCYVSGFLEIFCYILITYLNSQNGYRST